jgi:hypothetical protein
MEATINASNSIHINLLNNQTVRFFQGNFSKKRVTAIGSLLIPRQTLTTLEILYLFLIYPLNEFQLVDIDERESNTTDNQEISEDFTLKYIKVEDGNVGVELESVSLSEFFGDGFTGNGLQVTKTSSQQSVIKNGDIIVAVNEISLIFFDSQHAIQLIQQAHDRTFTLFSGPKDPFKQRQSSHVPSSSTQREYRSLHTQRSDQREKHQPLSLTANYGDTANRVHTLLSDQREKHQPLSLTANSANTVTDTDTANTQHSLFEALRSTYLLHTVLYHPHSTLLSTSYSTLYTPYSTRYTRHLAVAYHMRHKNMYRLYLNKLK